MVLLSTQDQHSCHMLLLLSILCAAAAMGLQPEAIPACRIMKQQLLAQLASLELPPNFLDQLIYELGGPSIVAEMTGRKGRVVQEQLQRKGAAGAAAAGLSPRVVYELRAKPDSSEMDSLNGECLCRLLVCCAAHAPSQL
jgi:hypothetical protein